MEEEDGKNFNSKDKFKFQKLQLDTQILLFDDVKKDFEFEKLYPSITGAIRFERKNKDAFNIPFEESPKILITSNYYVHSDGGGSEKRRKIEFEFSNHFSWNITPFDLFKTRFFDDWNESDWNDFYNFMFSCVSKYFQNGIPEQVTEISQQGILACDTSDDFANYIENNLLPLIIEKENEQEYDKQILYQEYFETIHLQNPNFKINTFTKYLKCFCEVYPFTFGSRKSDGKVYVSFIKVTK